MNRLQLSRKKRTAQNLSAQNQKNYHVIQLENGMIEVFSDDFFKFNKDNQSRLKEGKLIKLYSTELVLDQIT